MTVPPAEQTANLEDKPGPWSKVLLRSNLDSVLTPPSCVLLCNLYTSLSLCFHNYIGD